MKSLPLLPVKMILFSLLISITGCKKDEGFNVFSIQDDIELGQQVAAEIAADPATYPLLDPNQYSEAYLHLNRITDAILNSGQLNYKDEFPWQFRIVHDDNTLNAFAAPGGFIYVYTGLIKFLNAEHELAGVMAHEIAHADRRHVTSQLTKVYGIQVLLDVVLGRNQNIASDIAQQLAFLSFSRNHESDADDYSVVYLCPTDYQADGAAAFFEMIEAAGGGSPPEFLSTHPNPGNRVEAIHAKENELNCTGASTHDALYADFKASLP